MKNLLILIFFLLMLSCTSEIEGPPTLKITNLIKCDGVGGEGWYLSRLLTKDGKKIFYSRKGSGARPDHNDENILDIYRINESDHEDAKKIDTLYLDMYHSTYVEILCPVEYRILTEFSDEHEYINGVIHRFNSSAPFSSEIIKKHETGEIYAVYQIKDGYIKSPVKTFYKNGKVNTIYSKL